MEKIHKKKKNKKMNEYDYIFKILILGNIGVGKSSLVSKFVDEIFINEHTKNNGIDFKVKNISIYDKVIKLQIWDAASEKRFQIITSAYYLRCHGIILMYDMTDETCFINLEKEIEQIARYAPAQCIKMLVGNMADKEKEKVIKTEVAKEFADRYAMLFTEISVKNDDMKKTFDILTKEIYIKRIGGLEYTGLSCECCRILKENPKKEEYDPIGYVFAFLCIIFILLCIIGYIFDK